VPARTDTVVVEQSLPAQRLDRFLSEQFADVSRSTIQRLIIECHIKVDGRPTKPTHHPRAGEVVQVTWPNPKATELLPQQMSLEILHEDRDLIVINKPQELVVHPSAGHEDGTLVNALLHHCRGSLSGVGGVERPGIVHRLDLGTSGCLVVAKSDFMHMALSELFAARRVEKMYQCIVCGELRPEAGEIRGDIARHPTHRKRMVVSPGVGRPARTSYRLLERLRGATFVEVVLHTGRTHQIRVHFQHLGFPVLGDELYGKRPTHRLFEETGYEAPRQLLHARKLAFIHPRSRRFMEFNAPLPKDFKAALKELRIEGGGRGGDAAIANGK
jgi:23S rRNA pseudouridine1911/1915/1917 synthase